MARKKFQPTRMTWIMIAVWIVCGMTVSFNLGIQHGINLIEEKIEEKASFYSLEIGQNLTNFTAPCEGLNIFDAADCMRDNIMPIYNYTPKPDNETISLLGLKTTGGDCRDYSVLYNSMARDLGFYSTVVAIQVTEPDVGHAFTVISNIDGMCLLDGLVVTCWTFTGDDEDGG